MVSMLPWSLSLVQEKGDWNVGVARVWRVLIGQAGGWGGARVLSAATICSQRQHKIRHISHFQIVYTNMTNLLTYSPSSLPYLEGGVGKIFCRPFYPPPPSSCSGWGWGCGWLGPPLSFFLANARVGVGGKGKPLQMTNPYLSYILS